MNVFTKVLVMIIRIGSVVYDVLFPVLYNVDFGL
ncbi:hypothetical protein YN1HA_4950 [Sulfurisphaera ohwakuensis]